MAESYTVADYLRDKESVVSEIYTRLLASLREFGSVTESPKKTSIHLDNRSDFAGVYTRKSSINLNFRTSFKIDSPRIAKIEQHSANRFMHTVKLERPNDIDSELLGWLSSADNLSG